MGLSCSVRKMGFGDEREEIQWTCSTQKGKILSDTVMVQKWFKALVLWRLVLLSVFSLQFSVVCGQRKCTPVQVAGVFSFPWWELIISTDFVQNKRVTKVLSFLHSKSNLIELYLKYLTNIGGENSLAKIFLNFFFSANLWIMPAN